MCNSAGTPAARSAKVIRHAVVRGNRTVVIRMEQESGRRIGGYLFLVRQLFRQIGIVLFSQKDENGTLGG